MSAWRPVVNAAVQGVAAFGGAAATAITGDLAIGTQVGLGIAATTAAVGALGEDAVDKVFIPKKRDEISQQVDAAMAARFPGSSRKQLSPGRDLARTVLEKHHLTLEEWAALDCDPTRSAQAVLAHALAATFANFDDHPASYVAHAGIEETYRAMAAHEMSLGPAVREALVRLRRIQGVLVNHATVVERHLDDHADRLQRLQTGIEGVQRSADDQAAILRTALSYRPPDEPPAAVVCGGPPQPAVAFQDRTEAESAIDAAWAADARTVVLTQVVRGDGGVGKSQLASKYFDASSAPVRVWVEASTDDALVSGYAQAAIALAEARHLPPGFAHEWRENTRAAAQAFWQWLHTTGIQWFLVLDDLNVPAAALNDWWPQGVGRTLVTTRLADHAYDDYFTNLVPLDVFSPTQAEGYLTERLAKLPPAHLVGAADLAAALGHHPLALSLATALILGQGRTITEYLTLFREVPLPKALPGRDRSGVDDVITRTWLLSIKRAAKVYRQRGGREGRSGQPVRALANLIAFGHPTQTPRCLYFTKAARTYLAHAATPDAPPLSPNETWEALAVLADFSLITCPNDDWSPVPVHALAQRTIRELLDDDHHTAAAQALADAIEEAWPEIDTKSHVLATSSTTSGTQTITSGAILRSVAQELLRIAEPALITPTGVHRVVIHISDSLEEAGRAAEAVAYSEHLLSRLGALDPDHHDVLTVRANLASCRGCSGNVTQSLIEYQHLLPNQERALGDDHPDTLTTRANIARWRGTSGDTTSALTALENLLTDQIRVVGDDHPDTLTTRANIARWRDVSGDTTGALTAYEDLLTDQVGVVGDDHPGTLATRANIANLRGQSGDTTGAPTALENLLTDQVRVVGDDHPGTLATRRNIANLRGQSGDTTGALTALENLLTDRVRVLGADHPDTLTTRQDIAWWRGQSGDTTGALTALENLLTDQIRVLGADHPDTLTTRRDIARCRRQSGDTTGALTALENLLTDQIRVLGDDHRHTLATRHTIANVRGELGEIAGALAALENLLPDRVRVLGDDHPGTLITRACIAWWRGECGDTTGALTALENLLTHQVRVLGTDHPHTLMTRHNIAYWRGESGDTTGARTALEDLLRHQVRVLGADHPDTVRTRNDIVHWKAKAGRHSNDMNSLEGLGELREDCPTEDDRGGDVGSVA